MITNFSVKNFKCLIDVSFQPQPLNVIIGPNGSGKSALLQAVDFLRAFFATSVELYLKEKDWEFKDLPNLRQPSNVIQWDVTAELDADKHGLAAGAYRYTVSLFRRRYLGVGQEMLYYTAPGAQAERLLARRGRQTRILNRETGEFESGKFYRVPASIMSTLDTAEDREKYPELLRFRDWVEGFRSFLIWDPKILRSRDRGRHEELGPSGEHLAPLVALLKKRDPRRFEQLRSHMRRLFPYVLDVSTSGGRGWGWRSVQVHEPDITLNSRQMSDGVLRLLAVTSLRYVEHLPSLVMFEEPEDGVHPQLIKKIVQILRELTLRKPPHRCQVIFTTHSPYVLDEFYDQPESVFVMERPDLRSGTVLTQLSAASDLARVKETFPGSLGEAWFSGLIGGTAGVKRG